MKSMVIFHQCLQDYEISRQVAKELREKESVIVPFSKVKDKKINIASTKLLAERYCGHIHLLAKIAIDSKFMYCKLSTLKSSIAELTDKELVVVHNDLRSVFDSCLMIQEDKEFSRRTRLFSNIQYLVFADMVRVYNVYSVVCKEVLARFKDADMERMSEFKFIVKTYNDVVEKVQKLANTFPAMFNFQFKEPKYFIPPKDTMSRLDNMMEGVEGQDEFGEYGEDIELEEGMKFNDSDSETNESAPEMGRNSAGAVERIQVDDYNTAALDDLLGEEEERKGVSMGAINDDLINLNPFEEKVPLQETDLDSIMN